MVLISSCPVNLLKVGKFIIGRLLYLQFISKLIQGGEIWWLFDQLYKNTTNCLVLNVSRF